MLRWFYHPIALILLTLIGVLFSASLFSSLKKTRTSTEQVAVLEQEIEQMTSNVSDLEEQVAQAQTPEAQEKIIRDELLMQKEGEILVQLPEISENKYKRLEVKPSPKPWDEWKELLL